MLSHKKMLTILLLVSAVSGTFAMGAAPAAAAQSKVGAVWARVQKVLNLVNWPVDKFIENTLYEGDQTVQGEQSGKGLLKGWTVVPRTMLTAVLGYFVVTNPHVRDAWEKAKEQAKKALGFSNDEDEEAVRA